MNIKQKLLGLFFVLVPAFLFGQIIGGEEIVDESKITEWIPKKKTEYLHVYRFGISENDSELVLFFANGKYYAQVKSGRWSADGKDWIWHFVNITNVRIEGNKFYSDRTDGEFVIYDTGKEKVKGLKVYEPWSFLNYDNKYEIGLRTHSVEKYFPGKFKQASLTRLTTGDLKEMSKSDRKIMKNEIYARYGKIFESDKKMDKYFREQDWYKAQHKYVNPFLSELENDNIYLIQRYESRKKEVLGSILSIIGFIVFWGAVTTAWFKGLDDDDLDKLDMAFGRYLYHYPKNLIFILVGLVLVTLGWLIAL